MLLLVVRILKTVDQKAETNSFITLMPRRNVLSGDEYNKTLALGGIKDSQTVKNK